VAVLTGGHSRIEFSLGQTIRQRGRSRLYTGPASEKNLGGGEPRSAALTGVRANVSELGPTSTVSTRENQSERAELTSFRQCRAWGICYLGTHHEGLTTDKAFDTNVKGLLFTTSKRHCRAERRGVQSFSTEIRRRLPRARHSLAFTAAEPGGCPLLRADWTSALKERRIRSKRSSPGPSSAAGRPTTAGSDLPNCVDGPHEDAWRSPRKSARRLSYLGRTTQLRPRGSS